MILPPIVRAAAQSGVIMSFADMGTQVLVEEKEFGSDYNVVRTFRWGLAGIVLHGPYWFVGFSALDKRFGAATSILTVAKKTVTAQLVLGPTYLVGLFTLMGVLEGNDNIMEKIQTKVPGAYLSGCFYWPIANGLNFAFLPPTMRVPYVAASSGIWNSYLSWANARGDRLPATTTKEEETSKLGQI